MATITVANASSIFPAGTTVKAYPLKGFSIRDPDSGPPSGGEITSAAVAASGELTLTNAGLVEGSNYLLAAEVAGAWRYLHVRVNPAGEVTVIATQATGDFAVMTAGKGYRVKEGANAKQGRSAAMVAGALVIANTSVTANSRILVTRAPGGTNPGAVYVSAITAGTSFEVKSTSGTDTGEVFYEIFEPA